MSLDLLRAMLKLLQILQVESDVDSATKAYCKWAEDWNEKIKQKNWKRQEIFIPKPILRLKQRLKEYDELQNESKVKVKRWEEYNTAKSDVNRLKRKAEKIVSNVSKGIFPGDY